jgi:hydrogenase nickel incorporation protein HypB
LITKIDLEPHLDVSVKLLQNAIRTVRPDALVFALSARTGAGMQAWFDWVLKREM